MVSIAKGNVNKQETGFLLISPICFLLVILLLAGENCFAQNQGLLRPLLPPGRQTFPLQRLPIPVPAPVFSPVPVPQAIPEPPVATTPFAPKMMPGDVRIEITEKFLQRFLNRQETKSGAIQDFALGAKISGEQTTFSTVTFNCLPSQNGAQFNFDILGTVQTATTAFTPQARISQQGQNQFRATKPVLFNGTKLLTKKATLFVMPNQRVLGAQSRHSRLPLLGPLADRIAYGAANAHSSQSNLIAGQKLMRKLQPQIDTKTDQNLIKINTTLQEKIWSRLELIKFKPVSQAAHSTNDKIFLNYQFAEKTAPQPEFSTSFEKSTGDIRISLHEQLLATLLAKQKLSGKRISMNKIIKQANAMLQMVDPYFIKKPLSPLPVEVHFTYAEKKPFSVRFQSDEIELIMRGKFQIQTLPETETHRVRLTFKTELNEHQVVIKSNEIDIREESFEGKLMEPGFTQRAFVTQFQSLLLPVHIKRQASLPINIAASNTTAVAMHLKHLQLKQGWLDLSWDVTKQKQIHEQNQIQPPTLALPPPALPTPAPTTPTKTNAPKYSPLKFPEQNFTPTP